MNILDEIVAAKRIEVEESEKLIPLRELRSHIRARTARPFRALFDSANVVIAEIKPKSPSAGQLIVRSPLDIADLYAKSDADVISVLTDKKYFDGDLALLKDVQARVPKTLLRKDFILDAYQVYETAVSGADAFLLIASILSTEELKELRELGEALYIEALVEVHDEADIAKAIASGARVIGINNRDLKTLETDISVTERLMPGISGDIPVVSESGIFSEEDVKRVRAAGARGILVGTSVLQSPDPTLKINELKKYFND